jgi:serine/threonine-protein kinase
MTTVQGASSTPAGQQQPLMPRDTPGPPPGTEVGGLRIEALVDSGGQGTVYLAQAPDSGRRYALKFIPLGRSEARAWRELALSLQLHHPNLVTVVGSGLWPDIQPEFLWLKMVYVQGRPIDRWAWEENAGARAVTGKLLGVARGLAVAHDAGVVHRDVKEANILVQDGDGEAVLVDFGAAWSEGVTTLTQGLYPPGTPHYRSPEAWRFGLENMGNEAAHYRPGVADDLYALGVVLYRLLTHRYPFEVGDETSVRAVIHKAPLPPHLHNPRVPRPLSALCLKLLAKTPGERYPSATALCEALEELLAGADAAWRVPLREAPRDGGPGPAHTRLTPRLHRAAASVGVLVALGLGGMWLGMSTHEAESGQEVAAPWSPLEAGRAAAPPRVEDTPAAVASRAVPSQDKAPMKKQQKRSTAPADSKPRGHSSPLAAWCVGAAAAVSTACAGPQVRPAPEPLPQECPPGAVEAMTGPLGLYINDAAPYALFGDTNLNPDWVTVREGDITLFLQAIGKVPMDTTLYGRISFGKDRVYGRFTRAQTPTGETYPVCMELWDSNKRGIKLKAREGPDTATVFSLMHLKVVKRFE